MRFAPEPVANGENFDLVSCPGVEVLENYVGLCGQGGRALPRVVPVMRHLEFLLPRVNVALPRDVQPHLGRLQILDYRARGPCHLVEHGLVRFHLVADRLDDYRVIPAWQ